MQSGGESNLALLVIFAIGGLIFGGLLVFLVMNALRGQRDAEEDTHTRPLPKKAEETGLPPKDITSLTEAVPVEAQADDEDEKEEKPAPALLKAFSFWRSALPGQSYVKIDQTWHNSIQNMDQAQRERFLEDLKTAAAWFELSLLKEQPETPPPANVQAAGAAYGKAAGANKSAAVTADIPPHKKTIVEQVDGFLQEILLEDGLTDVNIRLTELMNRGLVVWVGKEFYEGIDAVPDPKVKELIRRAVQRWETTDIGR
jgi:hypothetical protein